VASISHLKTGHSKRGSKSQLPCHLLLSAKLFVGPLKRNHSVDINLARPAVKRAAAKLTLLVVYAPTKLPKAKLNKEANR